MIRQGWPYFEGWPFQERWLQIDGLGIHYVDEGYGSRPVVMVHGNPAWSYMWRNLIPTAAASKITPSIIKDSAMHPEKISEETMKAYWAPFPDDESKQAYQAFARMFPDSNYHPSFKPLKEVEQGLANLKVPTTIIWGTGRSGTTYAERISKMIPESKLETVNAGHFVPEDSPQEVEKLVQNFLESHNL